MAYEKQAMGMTMQVSEEFINNIAKQIVSESIMTTIGGGDRFVEQIVREILSTKVDAKGEVSRYNSRDDVPYINYLINKVIREEVTSVLEETVNEKRAEIRKTIKSELMKKETVQKFFDAFTDSLTEGLKSQWKTTINVSFNDKKENW